MVVERRGNKWCTVHCHGKDKGKIITCFPTKKEADGQHSAIMANKIEINFMSLQKGKKQVLVRGPKRKTHYRRIKDSNKVKYDEIHNIIDETNNLNHIGIEKIKSAIKLAKITDNVRIVSESEIERIMSVKHPERVGTPLSWYDNNKHEYVLNGKVFNNDLDDFEKYIKYSISKNWNKKGYNLKTLLLHEKGHQIARPDAFNIGYIDKDFQKAVEAFYIKYGGQDGVKQEVGNYAGSSMTEVLPEAYALTYSDADVSDDVKALGKLVKDLELKNIDKIEINLNKL